MTAGPSITVVLDIDGTLVDTNYQHAIAWHRALRAHGHVEEELREAGAARVVKSVSKLREDRNALTRLAS